MIPTLWSPSIQKYKRDVEWSWEFITGILIVNGFTKAKSVLSLDMKSTQSSTSEVFKASKSTSSMADFPNLNQNDIEDLYLLKIQNKIRNIKGVEEYDLINAIKMYIRRIVIKKRVKDVQMGVESCNNLYFKVILRQ
ncbi:hypothetical protein Tco_0086312 [Tanacetum coccineum]